MTDPNFDLAIIGLGPRGHFALEQFIDKLAGRDASKTTRILLFEKTDQLGNGPIWDTSQSESNWSNVSERVLNLPKRCKIAFREVSIDGFPNYHDWAARSPAKKLSDQPDTYPPRKLIGEYLHERFKTLLLPLATAGISKFVHDSVEAVRLAETGVCIETRSRKSYFAKQVLLTIGHQPTRQDPQIMGWRKDIKALDTLRLFEEPYPVEPIIDMVKTATSFSIAVRGYGLATIDIARAIAEAQGSFTLQDELTREQTFTPTEQGTLSIIPFSLDGLPMGPKPISEKLDRQFAPADLTLEELGRILDDPELQAQASGKAFLLDALAPVIASVYRSLDWTHDGAPTDTEDLHHLIEAWIDDPAQKHVCFLKADQPPIEFLKNLIQMAVGNAPISLDYCIGQVWRHCHPTIYKALSHGALEDDVLAEIIFTDETMKRYAFGPPTESLQQLIALHDAGVLNLNHLTDPDIAVSERGWVLSNGKNQDTARVMINAVLDAPKIADVRSPLIEGLLRDGVLAPVHDDLGVATTEDGYVISASGKVLPIAVLGRLAKGTIIGVDAILECFGDRPRTWAVSASESVVVGSPE